MILTLMVVVTKLSLSRTSMDDKIKIDLGDNEMEGDGEKNYNNIFSERVSFIL